MEEFLNLMRVSIMGSIPQLFVYLLFVFSFLQPQPKRLLQRLALFAVIHSLYTDSLQLVLPLPLHLLNSYIGQIVLFWLLFKDISTKKKIMLFILNNAFFMLMDLISVAIANYALGIVDREAILHGMFFRYLIIVYGQILIVLIASFYIRNRSNFKRYFSLLSEEGSGTLSKTVILIVIQFILLGTLQFVHFAGEKNKELASVIILFLTIAVSLTALAMVIRLIVRSQEQAVRMTQDVYVEDIHRMFASIRGQRHDFINHLQVIHSFAQMGKTDQLKRYVSDLVQETREMSEIVNHASPALAAFVQAKTTVAVAQGIAFSFELPSANANEERPIRDIDLVKILGNLVDNAFDEVLKLPPGSRFVHASVRLEEGRMLLEVANRGSVLSREAKENIFKAGYTTKTDGSHSGLGLAIVEERTKHYGGTLELHSDEQSGTVFRISIPVKEMKAV